MKDVYISYVPKDFSIISEICQAMDNQGITYQFGGDYRDSIDGCSIVLFVISQHSIASKWANEELVYAFNKKGKGTVIPYKIDNAKMPMSWEFIFSSINIRTLQEHPIDTILMLDVCQSLSRRPKGMNVDESRLVDIDTQGVDVMRKPRRLLSPKMASLLSIVFVGGAIILAIAGCVLLHYTYHSYLLPLGVFIASMMPLTADYVKKDLYEIVVMSLTIITSGALAAGCCLWMALDGFLSKSVFLGITIAIGYYFYSINEKLISRRYRIFFALLIGFVVSSGTIVGLWILLSPQTVISRLILGGLSIGIVSAVFIVIDDNKEGIDRKRTTMVDRINSLNGNIKNEEG